MRLDPLLDYSTVDTRPLFQEAVTHERVWFDERTKAYYIVQYDDVVRLLNSSALTTVRLADHHGMTEDTRELQQRYRGLFIKWPLFSDGEYHDRLRKQLSGSLAEASALGALRAQRLFAALPDREVDDFSWSQSVSEPLARSLVASLLNIESDETDKIIEAGSVIVNSLAQPLKTETHMRQAIDSADMLSDWLRARLSRSDNTSALVAALKQIADDEMLGFPASVGALAQIVTGSYDPTVSTLTVLALTASAPELRRLDSNTLCEEVLRLATPFRFARRFTLEAIDVGGVEIPRNSLVFLGLCTANVDPSAFACPHQVSDGRRSHVALSRGKHYCMGSDVVRSFLVAVIDEMKSAGIHFRADQVVCAPELSILRFSKVSGRLCRF